MVMHNSASTHTAKRHCYNWVAENRTAEKKRIKLFIVQCLNEGFN